MNEHPAHVHVPGQRQFGPAVDAFDERLDSWLEQVRGNPVLDRVFTAASHAGDFSMVWHGANLARGIVKRRPDQVVVLALLLGAESLLVNQGLKRIFRRPRPTVEGDLRHDLHVRRPLTSSFPSGHASAATFNATILSGWDGRRLGSLWWTLASVVAASRAYVRIHHASDVVGGIVAGRLLGLAGRRVARRLLAR